MSVVRGMWKLVRRQSTARKMWPGRMKSDVGPDQGASVPAPAAVSSVRTAVVPTAMTLPPRSRAAATAATVSGGHSHHSVCIG
jgi:hypothetical protein